MRKAKLSVLLARIQRFAIERGGRGSVNGDMSPISKTPPDINMWFVLNNAELAYALIKDTDVLTMVYIGAISMSASGTTAQEMIEATKQDVL